MLERFEKLRHSVQKALIDLNVGIFFSDNDIRLLSELINALTSIKLGVEALCQRDSNLLTADTTFSFILQVLDEQNNELASLFRDALLNRILERRTYLSDVLQYLHDGKLEVKEICPMVNKSKVTKKQ